MTPEGRKIWNSPQGVSLLRAMLAGQAPDQQQQQTLQQLKRADPPKLAQAESPSPSPSPAA